MDSSQLPVAFGFSRLLTAFWLVVSVDFSRVLMASRGFSSLLLAFGCFQWRLPKMCVCVFAGRHCARAPNPQLPSRGTICGNVI